MRPHKIHVSHGGEYNGETYIWCECLTPERDSPVHCFGSTDPHLFEGLFEMYPDDGDASSLLAFLKEHDPGENPPEKNLDKAAPGD